MRLTNQANGIRAANVGITFIIMDVRVCPLPLRKPLLEKTNPKTRISKQNERMYCDPAAITALKKSGTQIIVNPAVQKKLGSGTALKNGESLTIAKGIKIEAVPAYNTSPGHTQFHPKGRDNGYVLTIDGLRIYIAGDTEVIPEMAALTDIDVAFLPCNQPYTMTPEQVAKAAKTIKPKTLFPYHYSDTPVKRVAELLKGESIDVRIRNYK